MAIKREWVTPMVAGGFLLSAVTGVLMFFHLDTGLNKVAHEWLSWVFLGGMALHLTLNFEGLKRQLSQRKGQVLAGLFMLILLVSFVPGGEKGEPPFAASVRALSQTSLTNLALVVEMNPAQLQDHLVKAGLPVQSEAQSLADLVGSDLRQQVDLLNKLIAMKE